MRCRACLQILGRAGQWCDNCARTRSAIPGAWNDEPRQISTGLVMALGDLAPEDQPYVYFVQAETGGPIKIGVAANPWARLSGIQNGNPQKLRILRVMPGGFDAERALHKEFAPARMQGEWFKATPELLDFIGTAEDIAAWESIAGSAA